MTPFSARTEALPARFPGAGLPGGANPPLVLVWRGAAIESIHRGAWVVTDSSGAVLDGAGDWDTPVYARSSIKGLQALPLVESGAADRFGLEQADLALAVASHSGEPCHTTRAAAMLARAGCRPEDLRCGAHLPSDADARRALETAGEAPTALHNNCSGKHAGFLALAVQLGVARERYLEPASAGQTLVRRAIAEMSGVAEADLVPAVDGCSAPTYRLPLRGLATAFARFSTPDGLPAERATSCKRLCDAVAAHPVLLAGSRGRLCTDLVRASGGRLFPKVGAEAVYIIGVRGKGRALAVKLDDGGQRGLFALVTALVEELGLLNASELAGLASWRERVLKNHAGLEVGRVDVQLRG